MSPNEGMMVRCQAVGFGGTCCVSPAIACTGERLADLGHIGLSCRPA